MHVRTPRVDFNLRTCNACIYVQRVILYKETGPYVRGKFYNLEIACGPVRSTCAPASMVDSGVQSRFQDRYRSRAQGFEREGSLEQAWFQGFTAGPQRHMYMQACLRLYARIYKQGLRALDLAS